MKKDCTIIHERDVTSSLKRRIEQMGGVVPFTIKTRVRPAYELGKRKALKFGRRRGADVVVLRDAEPKAPDRNYGGYMVPYKLKNNPI